MPHVHAGVGLGSPSSGAPVQTFVSVFVRDYAALEATYAASLAAISRRYAPLLAAAQAASPLPLALGQAAKAHLSLERTLSSLVPSLSASLPQESPPNQCHASVLHACESIQAASERAARKHLTALIGAAACAPVAPCPRGLVPAIQGRPSSPALARPPSPALPPPYTEPARPAFADAEKPSPSGTHSPFPPSDCVTPGASRCNSPTDTTQKSPPPALASATMEHHDTSSIGSAVAHSRIRRLRAKASSLSLTPRLGNERLKAALHTSKNHGGGQSSPPAPPHGGQTCPPTAAGAAIFAAASQDTTKSFPLRRSNTLDGMFSRLRSKTSVSSLVGRSRSPSPGPTSSKRAVLEPGEEGWANMVWQDTLHQLYRTPGTSSIETLGLAYEGRHQRRRSATFTDADRGRSLDALVRSQELSSQGPVDAQDRRAHVAAIPPPKPAFNEEAPRRPATKHSRRSHVQAARDSPRDVTSSGAAASTSGLQEFVKPIAGAPFIRFPSRLIFGEGKSTQ